MVPTNTQGSEQELRDKILSSIRANHDTAVIESAMTDLDEDLADHIMALIKSDREADHSSIAAWTARGLVSETPEVWYRALQMIEAQLSKEESNHA